MKKAVAVIILFLLVFVSSTTAVYGSPTILGTLNGAVGAQGNWNGGYAKEASGDSLKMCYSGDAFGYKFEDVPAGVYKIAHYITLDSTDYGKRIRISPKVTFRNTELRCWVDWYTADTIATLSDVLDADKGKIIFVSIINVPRDGADIDVGFWQDTGAYIGTLDKVVLATADYDFQDAEYLLIGEKSYDADHTFNEDPEQQLLAPEGSWVASTVTTKEPTVTPVVTPDVPTAEMTPDLDVAPTTGPQATIEPALVDYVQTGLLIAIVAVAVVGVVGVVILAIWKGKK